MKTITAENLSEFKPTYDPYDTRLPATVDRVGVDSDEDLKEFRSEVRRWNKESAVGFTKEELNLIALILSAEEGNKRFDAVHFFDPMSGGNTAEHPIFIGHHIDKVRDRAGFGPNNFIADSPQQLAYAQLTQKLHAMAAVHDLGELVDISLHEQKAVNARSKEPEEEGLVGPFKLRLAAYAISTSDPMLYVRTIHEMRQSLITKKREIFEQAKRGEISGDDFVANFGKAIGESISAAEATLDMNDHSIQPAYASAVASLSSLFEETQAMESPASKLFMMFDKLEGDAHFRHFVGKPNRTHAVANDAPLATRLYHAGRHHSYHLASSNEVIGSITYAQKSIVEGLAFAELFPDADERDVARRCARLTAGEILRNHIQLLQKSPPFIDTSKQLDAGMPLTLSDNADDQVQGFRKRLDVQRQLREAWVKNGVYAQNPISRIDGVIDTKRLIAVFEKAANAIEEGSWTPTKADLPIGFGQLPDALQVTRAEMAAANSKYPLEVASHYCGETMDGKPVSL